MAWLVTEEGEGAPSLRPLWMLLPYLWPKGHPELKARVLASVFCPPPQPEMQIAAAAKQSANPRSRRGRSHWNTSEELIRLLSDTGCPF